MSNRLIKSTVLFWLLAAGAVNIGCEGRIANAIIPSAMAGIKQILNGFVDGLSAGIMPEGNTTAN